jgi:hypothetical protein
MTKPKTKWQTVSIILPAQWVKLLDADAKRMKRTRTALIKSLIIDYCIRRAK